MRLALSDVQAISTCIERLYACRSLAEFPQLACVELSKLVGADNTTFNYVATAVGKYAAAWVPDLGRFEERVRLTAALLHCHPVANHQLATGDMSARLISDFCDEQEYHRLPIYEPLYRDMGYEDQLVFLLFPLGGEMIAMAFARDRRSFTERDRRIANLVRPHVAQAYRNAEAFSRLSRAGDQPPWARELLRVSSVTLNSNLRPRRFGGPAREWIERFFPEQRPVSARLPVAVENWIHATLASNGRQPALRSRLTRRRGAERLSMSCFRGPAGDAPMLVLELDTPSSATGPLLRAGLTRREVEVLQHLESGRTNVEIAAKLGISAQTVRAHLEHIFRKLSVTNRTAAVAEMRRRCAM